MAKEFIICVDDEQIVLNSLNTQLKKRFGKHYSFEFAESGEEALAIIEEILKDGNEVVMTISDQLMPGMTGDQFLVHLHQTHPRTIKVLLTGQAGLESAVNAINNANLYRYLLKPWDEADFLLTIEKGLKEYYLMEEMEFLHTVAQKISETRPLPQLMTEIMENSKKVMRSEVCSLLLYEAEESALYFHSVTQGKSDVIKGNKVKMGSGIAGWVAEHRQTIIVEDCYQDERFNRDYDKQTNFQTRNMICAPLVQNEKLIGVIQVMNRLDEGKFDESDLTIFNTLAAHCAIAINNARLIAAQIEAEALERELNTARLIQQRLLPAKLPAFTDIEVFGKLIPAKQVGGDYYNVLKVNETQTLFFIADVSGKSISAALLVSTLCAALQTYLDLHQNNFSLMTLVSSMNRVLINSTTADKFATAWFGFYDHPTRTLTSVNAGHNPPYIFQPGKETPIELRKGGLFLGMMDLPYVSEDIKLNSGDVLIFFTDGVTEAWNCQEEEYEETRLIQCISKHRNASAATIHTAINDDVQSFVGDATQSDDFTCGVMKVN